MCKNPELKPCPFCGGDAHVFEDDDNVPRWVTCKDCEADGPHDGIVNDVVNAWNERT